MVPDNGAREMKVIKNIFFPLLLLAQIATAEAQQTQLNPLTCYVFVPYIYNPAIVGSKDYLSVDLNTSFLGQANSELLSANARLSKTLSGYFSSPDIMEFRNIGLGGSLFHDLNGTSRNIGGSVAGSYQFPLNLKNISFISAGASFKGVYNIIDTALNGLPPQQVKTFHPDLDAGIYYYGANLFAGISAINLLSSHGYGEGTGVANSYGSRQYFLSAGYKFILSRTMNIILEPSFLASARDTTFGDLTENINPILRLYIENFCVGTYFLTDNKFPFFIQFRYPSFYLGAFFEFPKNTPFFKSTPTVAFTAGLNLARGRSRLSNKSHW